jgi:quercetin dioxygenase-like cupin family protein
MKRYSVKINFKDKRGAITDVIVNQKIDTITHITFTKGAVRGNHFHKKTIQYDYVLKGELECATRKGLKGKIVKTIIKQGDVIVHPARECHAFKAVKGTAEILSITYGPRRGNDFELDTVRLKEPILI